MDDWRPHLKVDVKEKSIRTYDGGGGGTYPRESYARHAKKVFSEAQAMGAALERAKDHNATERRYFRVRIPKEQSIWSGAGATLAEALHGSLVGAPSKTIGHVSSTTQFVALLNEELARYIGPRNVGKSKFAAIEEISSIPADEKLSLKIQKLLAGLDGSAEVLISVFPDLSHIERRYVVETLKRWVSTKGGYLGDVTEGESGTYIRLTGDAELIRETAESFLTVQSVDAIEYAIDLSSARGLPVPEDIAVLPNNSSAIAGVIDSGVLSGSRFIDGSVVAREHPLGAPFDEDHGTTVASRIIYGDTLRDQVATGTLEPSVKIVSVCTQSHDAIGNRLRPSTDQLVRIVRETVQRWHKKVRVFNISQNLVPPSSLSSGTVADDIVNPLAAELDHLSRRYSVLFVLSAGNFPLPGIPQPSGPYPEYFTHETARILPPGEAVLALTVGSIAERANSGSLAPDGYPSPFTRRGPGFARFRKPDVVAHGGNYGLNWKPTEDLSVVGIGSHGDNLSYGNGTSFSAPLVARFAAQLFSALPDATPDLVRALIVHSCRLPDGAVANLEHLLGNGRPEASSLLRSTRWRQAFVHTGTIPFREIRRLPFYVPEALCSRRGNGKVRIRATVCYSPETQRTLKAGYCKSHIRCKIRKINTSGKMIDVRSEKGQETILDRYAAITRFEKSFSRAVAGGNWELVLEHESRWTTKGPLPFALIVTVEDPREDEKVDILRDIRAEVPNEYATTLSQPIAITV